MPRNVEIKARINDMASLTRRVASLATEGPILIVQRDTFFAAPHGRLKLRRFVGRGDAELIAYRRADTAGPKTSRFERVPVTEPDALERALGAALGTAGVVAKRRTLYRIGRTRVHLDEVEGLGAFVELEVVLAPQESAEDGEREARDLLRTLAIPPASLVTGAYVDLLA